MVRRVKMKTKIPPVSFFLIGIIFILGGLSIFIVTKLKEEKPGTVPIKTKAADVTYKKLIALNSSSNSPTPTSEIITPTSIITQNPEETLSPTPINLVVTPILTPESTPQELAYNLLTPTTDVTPTISPTSQAIKTLPQSGIYQISLFVVFFSFILITFSFIL